MLKLTPELLAFNLGLKQDLRPDECPSSEPPSGSELDQILSWSPSLQ